MKKLVLLTIAVVLCVLLSAWIFTGGEEGGGGPVTIEVVKGALWPLT